MTVPELQRKASAAPAASRAVVSVVIPSYNHARFVGDAIESVARQVYDGVEIVVVDDGSTDDTAAVVRRYPDVKYVRQENQGLAAARNTGIRHATGEYLVFLDADDRLLPDALASGLDCLRAHPDAAFTWGRFRYVDGDGLPLDETAPPSPHDDDAYRALLRKNHIVMHATVMYRRAAVEQVGGFDASLRACEDYDLYLRLASEYPVCRHSEMVAEYRKHDANMSRDAILMLDTVLTVLTKQAQRAEGDASRRAAFREGVRFYRDLYAEQLLGQLRRDPRGLRDRAQAVRGVAAMLRYGPKWLARRTIAAARPAASWVRRRLTAPRVGNVDLGDLRRVTPISNVFGFDRGRPIDRYYIERFLTAEQEAIRGRVLEIADNVYTKRFGGDRVTKSDVLHLHAGAPGATFTGDLTAATALPSDAFDCIVLTQTLQYVYDVRAALATLHRILRPGGVLLATLPGAISPIEQGYWGERWCWGFTMRAAAQLFGEVFPPAAITMDAHGNVLAATAFLHGLAVEELRPEELEYHDPHYQIVITVRAVKPTSPARRGVER